MFFYQIQGKLSVSSSLTMFDLDAESSSWAAPTRMEGLGTKSPPCFSSAFAPQVAAWPFTAGLIARYCPN